MSEETTHPDAVCMASNLPCGDLSEALIERDALRARVAELEEENHNLRMLHDADAAAIGQMARKALKN